MSDSELSSAANIPADSEIERCLERVTRALVKDETQDPTINVARSRAEQELGLEAGFLKSTAEWKDRSKQLIYDTVQACEKEEEEELAKPAPKAKAKPKAKPVAKAAKKRKSDDEESGSKKRRKKSTKVESEDDVSEPDPELDDDEDEDEDDVKPAKKQTKRTVKKPVRAKASAKVVSDSEDEDVALEQEPSVKTADEEDNKANGSKSVPPKDTSELSNVPDKLEQDSHKTNGKSVPVDDDESDMSVLIDDPPPKKKRQRKTASSDTKSKTTAKSSKTTKSKASGKEVSPDDEEIKRLQGWLVKCGIRKRWHLELTNCSTPKEKIKHLKKMLDEAGMTGRYSNEKAKQIKEARELAEEIEAAQEFNERWGQSEGDDDDDDDDAADKKSEGGDNEEESKTDGPPKRRLPKGFVDFGDSGDDGSD